MPIKIRGHPKAITTQQLQTTDATVTVVHTRTLIEGEAVAFHVEALGFTSTEDNVHSQTVQNAFYRDTGGAAVRVGTSSGSGIIISGISGARVTFAVSGNDAIIQVKGKTSTTIDWEFIIEEMIVG